MVQKTISMKLYLENVQHNAQFYLYFWSSSFLLLFLHLWLLLQQLWPFSGKFLGSEEKKHFGENSNRWNLLNHFIFEYRFKPMCKGISCCSILWIKQAVLEAGYNHVIVYYLYSYICLADTVWIHKNNLFQLLAKVKSSRFHETTLLAALLKRTQ